MPFVNIQTIKGIMTDDEKATLLDRITDLVVEIEGKGNAEFRKDVWVRIDEHEPESWSLGGRKPTRAFIEGLCGNNR
jgi:4-oxalocrotonate tautomerase